MEQKSPQLLSKDFFLQRSFEVAWAVFRVAEYVTRPSLRGALEEKAIAYLLHKDSEHLAGLEEVVRLSIHTNDIGSVNGSVLLREIGNLKSFLSSDTYSTIKSRDLVKTPQNAPSVEEVFAKPPMVLSSFAKATEGGPSFVKTTEDRPSFAKPSSFAKATEDTAAGRPEDTADGPNPALCDKKRDGQDPSPALCNKERNGQDPTSNKVGTDNPIPPQRTGNPIPPQRTGKDTLTPSFVVKDGSGNPIPPQRTGNPIPDKVGSGNPIPNKVGSGNESGNLKPALCFKGRVRQEVRQTTILSFVQGRNLCHIKDLMHSLPDISERTLRYDIQKLVNSGKLERVGSGGPNSFFRLRKKENPKL